MSIELNIMGQVVTLSLYEFGSCIALSILVGASVGVFVAAIARASKP